MKLEGYSDARRDKLRSDGGLGAQRVRLLDVGRLLFVVAEVERVLPTQRWSTETLASAHGTGYDATDLISVRERAEVRKAIEGRDGLERGLGRDTL